MSDPAYPLQVAIVAALKADSGVSALVGARVYDQPPPSPVFPYISLGDGQVVGDDTECGAGSEVFFQVHVWSRSPGFPETKQIAAAVRTALTAANLTLTGFTVPLTEYVHTMFLRDEDGLTRHAVVEFRYLITHTT